MGELFLAMLSRVVEQRSRRVVLLKWEEVAEEGSDDAVQTDSVKGQNGKYPGNKDKKLELSLLASDKALSTVAMLSE